MSFWTDIKHQSSKIPENLESASRSDHVWLFATPGFSVHGIFQARVLEWVAISFSRRSSRPRDWTQISCIVGRCFTVWATREVFFLANSQPTPRHLSKPSQDQQSCLATQWLTTGAWASPAEIQRAPYTHRQYKNVLVCHWCFVAGCFGALLRQQIVIHSPINFLFCYSQV